MTRLPAGSQCSCVRQLVGSSCLLAMFAAASIEVMVGSQHGSSCFPGIWHILPGRTFPHLS